MIAVDSRNVFAYFKFKTAWQAGCINLPCDFDIGCDKIVDI